jgi:flagellar export protein FliJ
MMMMMSRTRFSFNLQSVLELRHNESLAAQQVLQREEAKEYQIQSEINALSTAIAEAFKRFNSQHTDNFYSAIHFPAYMEGQRKAQHALNQRMAQQKRVTLQARQAFTAVKIKEKGLETLRDHQQRAWQLDEQRRENLLLDEMGIQQFYRKQTA